MSNLTSRIISGNGRKQVSVYRRLQKDVKLCKLILREAEPCTNSRRALDRSFVLLNPLIITSRSYFRPEAVNNLAVEILLRNFFYAKLASLKFFFKTVVARRVKFPYSPILHYAFSS